MRTVAPALCLCAGLLSQPALAQGGPPMLTDDPGTPGDGRLETNFAATIETTDDERSAALPMLDVNYGVGERIQLNVETSLNRVATPGESHWGLGAASLAVKWRLADPDSLGVSLSIYPRIERAVFGSSIRRGLAQAGTQVLLPVEASWQVAAVGVDVEIGSLQSSASGSRWVFGAVGAFTVSETTEAMLELHGEALSRFEQDSLVLNAGFRRRVAAGVSWIASAGRALRSGLDDSPSWLGYCGLQWTR